jgi:hypothetical protein
VVLSAVPLIFSDSDNVFDPAGAGGDVDGSQTSSRQSSGAPYMTGSSFEPGVFFGGGGSDNAPRRLSSGGICVHAAGLEDTDDDDILVPDPLSDADDIEDDMHQTMRRQSSGAPYSMFMAGRSSASGSENSDDEILDPSSWG